MKKFRNFWDWLKFGPHTVKNLGGRGDFDIIVPNQAGQITVHSSGKVAPFTEEDALRTWDRYHGLFQAEDYLVKNGAHLHNAKSPFESTSGYSLPGSTRYPQNWDECPNMICCPFIAAAIRYFLKTPMASNASGKSSASGNLPSSGVKNRGGE